MKDDISAQLLSQTSDNIQRLFDLTTRIDERVKSIQAKQSDMDGRLSSVMSNHHELVQRLAVAESKLNTPIHEEVDALRRAFIEIEKRLISLEQTSTGHEKRWNGVFQFVVQLVWITLAAYVLYKLNLNPPPVP